MSSPNKMSVCGAGFCPEGGEQAGIRPADAGAPWELVLGLERGTPHSGKSKQEVMKAGGPVLWGRKGQPGFLADDKGDAVNYASHLADEAVVVAVLQQLSDQDVPGEIQLMRMSLYPKEGGQAKPSSPEDSGDTPRHWNLHLRENFPHVPGSIPPSAPRGFTSAVERQAVGQLDISSTKKMQSVFWEKVGSRPSYPGTGAGTDVSTASTGGLPQATPEKKAQGKKVLEDVSKGTLEKLFPSWGQRVLEAPLETATFPPVSGVQLLQKSKRYSLVRLNTKHCKHKDAGKKSVARKTGEFELLVGEDNNPYGDPVPKGQHGECHTGDLDTRAAEVPGNSQSLTPIQKDIMPREPAPSDESCDQEPLNVSSRPERQQQPPGAQGCCQCVVLQREIDELKMQLAAMQFLVKFQTL